MTEPVAEPAPPPSDRTRVRRIPEHASYDRAVIDAILDEALVAHLGLVAADGTPVVIPTLHARRGDEVLVHGSTASRAIRTGASGAPISLAVTLLDGVIVARSLFESSMAYRSVVIVGAARAIDDPDEKLEALLALSERLIPGRSAEARLPDAKELAATRVLAIPLDEATAKVSPPVVTDAERDLGLPIWAGVIPLSTTVGAPVADPSVPPGVEVPPSVGRFEREH